MLERLKLEGNEIWECYGLSDEEIDAIKQSSEARREIALVNCQNWILSNLNNICLMYEAEDESFPVTIAELQTAISTASVDDLEQFLKTKTIPFEDGYICVTIRR